MLVLYSPNVAPSVPPADNVVSNPPMLVVEVVVVVMEWKLPKIASVSTVEIAFWTSNPPVLIVLID